jgi:hypothetical protein
LADGDVMIAFNHDRIALGNEVVADRGEFELMKI